MLGLGLDRFGVYMDKRAQQLETVRVKKQAGLETIHVAMLTTLVILIGTGDQMDGKDFPAFGVIG